MKRRKWETVCAKIHYFSFFFSLQKAGGVKWSKCTHCIYFGTFFPLLSDSFPFIFFFSLLSIASFGFIPSNLLFIRNLPVNVLLAVRVERAEEEREEKRATEKQFSFVCQWRAKRKLYLYLAAQASSLRCLPSREKRKRKRQTKANKKGQDKLFKAESVWLRLAMLCRKRMREKMMKAKTMK